MVPPLRDFCIDSGIGILENDIFHSLDDLVLFFPPTISVIPGSRQGDYSRNADVARTTFLSLSVDRSILSDLTIQSFATDFSGCPRRLPFADMLDSNGIRSALE